MNQNVCNYLESKADEMLLTLQELIRIPSYATKAQDGMPFGQDCAKALSYILDKSEALGMKTANLDNYIGYCEYGQGETYYGILTHLDVVPEGEGWKYPPYAAQVVDGMIYGRGTSDDKGPAVSALYALAAVAQANVPMRRRVRVIFGCDEESGWQDIDYYQAREKMPDLAISPDGDYPVVNAEKGIMHVEYKKDVRKKDVTSGSKHGASIVSISGGTRPNVVAGKCVFSVCGLSESEVSALAKEISAVTKADFACEQAGDNVKVTVSGFGAHASTPHIGVNAICAALELIKVLPLDGEDQIVTSLRALADAYPFGDWNAKAAGFACSDPVSGELTANFGQISFEQGLLLAVVDIRFPLDKKGPEMENVLRAGKLLSEYGFDLSVLDVKDPHHVPEDSELVQALLKVYGEQTGLDPFCIAIGGGTYARAMKNAVNFGCAFPGYEELAHQPNECIPVEDIVKNAKIIAHTILELCC